MNKINKYYELVIPFNNKDEAIVWFSRLKEGSMLPVQMREISQNW